MEEITTSVIIDDETSPITLEKTELDLFDTMQSSKSKKTHSVYVGQYKKLVATLGGDFKNFKKEDIADKVAKITSANSRNLMLMICIFLSQMYGDNIGATYFADIRAGEKTTILKETKARNKETKEHLPTLEDFEGYLFKLDNENKSKEYIINWLFYNYYVRNKDVDVKFVKTIAETKNFQQNYIIILRDKIKFVRNVYKTIQKHKPQTHVIKCVHFRRHCLKFFKENKESQDIFLLTNHGTESIGSEVQRLTYKQLGEGKLFKMAVLEHRNNIDMIKYMSQTRGTGIDVLLENYDVENQ